MTHSPILNPDNFLDSDNPRYHKAVSILQWLLKNQDGGDYTYVDISNDLHLPQTTVREFLVPEVWVWRSYDYLENLKQYNYQSYMYYIANSQNPNTYKEEKDKYGCEINIAKFHYMKFVASLHGAKMIKSGNKYVAFQLTEDEQMQYVNQQVREMDENLLLPGVSA